MGQNTSKTLVWAVGCLIGLFTQVFAQNSTMRKQVYFATGSYELDDAAKEVLDGIVTHEETQVIKGVKVAGFTDAVGSDEANYELSKKRALTVARYLRDFGINASVVKLSAFGEDRAVASNETVKGRKLNRRVELKVYLGAVKEVPDIMAEVVEEVEEEAEDKIVAGNKGEYDCEKGLRMKGRRGVTIEMAGGTFEDCEGETITVMLGEYTQFEKVVGDNVSTMAGDTMLESAGMICLSAYANQQQINDVRAGRYITVKVPADQFDPGMMLYFSDQSSDVSGIEWTSTPSAPVAYEDSTNSYVFQTNNLTCINLDKPAKSLDQMPVAIRVKKKLMYNTNMYLSFEERGTFTQGRESSDRYIVFGSLGEDEDVRLKGYLSNGRTLYKIDKDLPARKRKVKTIMLNGEEHLLLANVNKRGIGRKDNFISRKSYLSPAYGAVGK